MTVSSKNSNNQSLSTATENYLKHLKQRKPVKGIHSRLHQLTREITEWVGEPKAFGKWIGITSRIGVSRMESILASVKEKGIRNPRYLMGCVRKK